MLVAAWRSEILLTQHERGSMGNQLSSSAQKVQAALAERGLACEVVELPESTRSAQEAANAIGCQVEQIVKSLVFRSRNSGHPVLVLASGPNRVNEVRLAELNGEPVARADAGYVREHTGFTIGGVPPLGHTERLRTFIDEDLLRYDELWAAAGTPHAVFRLTPTELLSLAEGQVVGIK
jgi:prolyl-tRNA editing enzyme YbaK/EbsC (Cys-tRNA(Pro) deacylase)